MALLVPYSRASLLAFAGLLFYPQTATTISDTPTAQATPASQATPLVQASPQIQEQARTVKRPAPKPLPLPANLILLDPAHGGDDAGASLASTVAEKDWTLAFAERLEPMLAAHGFNVIIVRGQPSDNAAPASENSTPTEDQRAEQANRLHPLACLLLHATNGGHGVHLFTSALTPSTLVPEPHAILPWNAAQAASITDSLRLATDLSTALNGSRIPLVLGRASVPPIDSLACPAVAIELASLTGAAAGLADPAYQHRVAEAIVNAMVFWRGHTETAAAQAAAAAASAAAASTPSAKLPEAPGKKPRPKPAPLDSNPETEPAAPRKPAPIIRRPPRDSPIPDSPPPDTPKPEPPTSPSPTGATP